MGLPEKIWILDNKLNGQHITGYDFFNTEEEAYNAAISEAYKFIDSLGRNYQGFAFMPKENKSEVYVDNDTYSWEWEEFPMEQFINNIIERHKNNDLCSYV